MKQTQTILFSYPNFVFRQMVVFGTIFQLTVLFVSANPIEIPSPTQSAIEYHYVSNLAWGVNQVLTLLFPIILLAFGLGNRILSAINTMVGSKTILALVLFAICFVFLNWVIQLPMNRIRANTFNQIMNFENSPVFLWIYNHFLESLLLMFITILAVLGGYWLINKSPKKWWLWAAGILLILTFIFLIGEPFIKSYKPIGNSPIESKILELTEKVGIPRNSLVLESCEPIDSCGDARVIGLGPTRLIVLNEGYIQTRPPSWTIQTVAHEAKHFTKDDNLLGFVVLSITFLIYFWLLKTFCNGIIPRFSNRLGFTALNQAASLPLIFLLSTSLYLISLPPINLFRQHIEFEADRYGLELTQENEVLAKLVSSWTHESKLRVPKPSVFYMLFRSSHPSDADRITFANEYQTWKQEDAGKK